MSITPKFQLNFLPPKFVDFDQKPRYNQFLNLAEPNLYQQKRCIVNF